MLWWILKLKTKNPLEFFHLYLSKKTSIGNLFHKPSALA